MRCIRPVLPKWSPLGTIVLLLGCSDSGLSTSNMPLAVGNEWTYVETDGISSNDVTVTINRTADVGGHEYFLTNTNLSFAWTSEGLSLAALEVFEATVFGLEVLLRQPAPADPYEYTSSIAPDSFWYVAPSQEEIDVPAGHFSATTYRIFNGDSHSFLFSISFAEGVGIVRLVNTSGTSWLLKSYKLVDSRRGLPFLAASAP